MPQLNVFILHLHAVINVAIIALLISGRSAARQGERARHRVWMLGAVALGGLFLATYLYHMATVGHAGFPGDDWVRTSFLVVLVSHILMAVALVPLLVAAVFLAVREKIDAHRRVARCTYWAWMYVSVTALFIYTMNTYVRPPL